MIVRLLELVRDPVSLAAACQPIALSSPNWFHCQFSRSEPFQGPVGLIYYPERAPKKTAARSGRGLPGKVGSWQLLRPETLLAVYLFKSNTATHW